MCGDGILTGFIFMFLFVILRGELCRGPVARPSISGIVCSRLRRTRHRKFDPVEPHPEFMCWLLLPADDLSPDLGNNNRNRVTTAST